MKLYLAYESSLALMRYLRSTDDGTIKGTPVKRTTLRDAIWTMHQLKDLKPAAEQLLTHIDGPIHAFVGERKKATRINRLATHLWSDKVLSGSFIDIGHDICISTPSFLFLQMATVLDTAELVALGMELCGHYSKWSLPPARLGDLSPLVKEENRHCTFNLLPAASARKLRAFVDRSKGLHGAVAARTSMRWVLDEAASPMETVVYLLLCLPKRLGGYGLPAPILNPKVIVRGSDGSKERFPDLFWQGAAIDVEYNSDYAHAGDWSRYRDSAREVELVANNITVLPLTRLQVMHKDDFHAFAQSLRRLLGIRGRGFDANWERRHDELRSLLLPKA